MNIDKYLDNVIETRDGMVYKTNKSINEVGENEIVYIHEYAITELYDDKVIQIDSDDEALIDIYGAETKKTITKKLQKAFGFSTKEIEQHDMVQTIVNCCNWECVDTLLDRLEKHELLTNKN